MEIFLAVIKVVLAIPSGIKTIKDLMGTQEKNENEIESLVLPDNLPFPRNRFFTGRDQIFGEIRKGFESGSTISLAQTITGMGGLGKTQTALEYAYRYADKYNLIRWVQAESDVIPAYKLFALEKELIKKDESDNDFIIRMVFNWMSNNDKWLFIYDNAEGEFWKSEWFPKNYLGNILVTTRNNLVTVGKKIDISVFTEDEAIDFFDNRIGKGKGYEDAKVLAKRLGYLPLALEQAAAYMLINEKVTYVEYLRFLDEHGLKVLEKINGVINYVLPVTATMEIATEKLETEEARQLLYLCAYIAPEDIDEALFYRNTEYLPSPLSEAMSDNISGNDVWLELIRYSLLKKQDDGNYSMHRLLQEVVRNKTIHDQQWMLCWLSIFCDIYKFEYGNIASHQQFTKLTLHVEAFLDTATKNIIDDEHMEIMGHLYNQGGVGFIDLRNDDRALEWIQKALAIYEKVSGTEHPDTAITYSDMAGLYNNQGDYSKALEFCHNALAINEKVLGKEHPNTATTYNNMAIVYNSQGDYSKAHELYQKALAIYEKVLGKEHPHTASTYNNIANVYNDQGDYSKAHELYQKASAICEKIIDKEHPETASTYYNMANMHYHQGNYSKAFELYKKALAIFEKVLGKEHQSTIMTIENMAITELIMTSKPPTIHQ